MIATLRLRHFKRFERLDLDFGGLTVLTGPNGAGKTTAIHAVLLARQAATTGGPVALNGPFGLQLGEASDVLNRTASGRELQIGVEEDGVTADWRMSVPDDRSLNLTVTTAPDDYQGVLAKPTPAFTYLCAERLGPRDVLNAYSGDVSTLGVGTYGEYTAQVLSVHRRLVVKPGRCTTPPEDGAKQLDDLLHQTEWWMHRIVRPLQIDAEWFVGTSVTRLQFKTPGIKSEWTRPPNMGFGVSYALPIIVAGLQAPVGGLLIVENPEAHLHPAGQSGIGAFLAQVAASGLQVIVETHSDHVVNGIRRAVVESPNTVTHDARVYFFHGETEAGAAPEPLVLSRTGDLSSWPTGFFDQIERDLGVIARARRRKT